MLEQKQNLQTNFLGSVCIEQQTLSVVIEVTTCAIAKSVWNNPKDAPKEAKVCGFANERAARQPNDEVTPKEAKVSAFPDAKADRQATSPAGRRWDEWIILILQGGAYVAIMLQCFLSYQVN